MASNTSLHESAHASAEPAQRRRVRRALEHLQPDRVPLDLGATAVTGVHCSVVAAMREHLGLEKRPVKVIEPYQMLGQLDDGLKSAIGVDVEGVIPHSSIFGYRAEGWKEWRAPWGQELLVPRRFNTTADGAGNVYMHPEGDTNVPPSGHMPKGGYFFDAIVRQGPIDEEKLDVRDNLEEFKSLSEEELNWIESGVRAAAKTGRAVLVSTPGTALGDIALVPAPFLKHPKGVRDIAEWYMSISTRADYVRAIFTHQVTIALVNLQRINDRVGDLIDVVMLCGTDFGTQSSQFCSLHTFRDIWLPHYRVMTDWIHANTNWKVFKHSCGAVVPLLDGFIDAGFDILNPVQCSAVGMEPHELKRSFGQRLSFWGGGIDTQKVLPFGTPQQVREQVLERCDVFSAGGGFVFNTIHNVQAMTPTENVFAMLDAVREFNGVRATRHR